MTTAPMTTAPAETLSVVVEREIPFAPEKIWRALTQQQAYQGAWFGWQKFFASLEQVLATA